MAPDPTASITCKCAPHHMHTALFLSPAPASRPRRKWSSASMPQKTSAVLPCHSTSTKAGQASRAPLRPKQISNVRSPHETVLQASDRQTARGFQAGPVEAAPSYTAIDSVLLNRGIMALFRQKMVEAIGEDSKESG